MAEVVDPLATSLHEGDVRIARQPIVTDYDTDGVPADAFHEAEIEIPLRGEEIRVSLRPVVRESVVVTKYLRERAIPVRGVVRRETLDIEGDAIVDERDDIRLERGRNGRLL